MHTVMLTEPIEVPNNEYEVPTLLSLPSDVLSYIVKFFESKFQIEDLRYVMNTSKSCLAMRKAIDNIYDTLPFFVNFKSFSKYCESIEVEAKYSSTCYPIRSHTLDSVCTTISIEFDLETMKAFRLKKITTMQTPMVYFTPSVHRTPAPYPAIPQGWAIKQAFQASRSQSASIHGLNIIFGTDMLPPFPLPPADSNEALLAVDNWPRPDPTSFCYKMSKNTYKDMKIGANLSKPNLWQTLDINGLICMYENKGKKGPFEPIQTLVIHSKSPYTDLCLYMYRTKTHASQHFKTVVNGSSDAIAKCNCDVCNSTLDSEVRPMLFGDTLYYIDKSYHSVVVPADSDFCRFFWHCMMSTISKQKCKKRKR